MAIPYATWANRGRGQMAVWLARTDAAARPTPFPTVATTSTLTHLAAQSAARTSATIIDGEEPRDSNDSTSYFDWWPRKGCARRLRPQPAPAPGQRRSGASAARANGSR